MNRKYEELDGTIEILKSKSMTKALLKALEEADSGKTLSFEEVVGRKQKRI